VEGVGGVPPPPPPQLTPRAAVIKLRKITGNEGILFLSTLELFYFVVYILRNRNIHPFILCAEFNRLNKCALCTVLRFLKTRDELVVL